MIKKMDGFDWDEANIYKCQKHGISTSMIEDFFKGPISVISDAGHSGVEERHIAVGRIPDGRPMFVGFTFRQGETSYLIRPITARFMHKREIQKYEKAVAKIQER